MTPDLKQLQELLAAATPGPWEMETLRGWGFVRSPSETGDIAMSPKEDAALIVAMHEALPALLASHEALSAEVAGLRDAGVAMLAKLDQVEKDTAGIFVMAHVHGADYKGANWGDEYKALRAAIDAAREGK